MSGIHTVYRKSKDSNFVEVESTIYLPSVAYCRENEPINTGYNGAFPEFFHGFYKGSDYGLDICIIYKGGGYRLAFYSYPNIQPTQWFTSDFFAVGTSLSSRTFTLKSYLQDGYSITRCYNNNNTLVASLDVFLTTAAFNSMKQGCTINRELCVAINTDAERKINLPANCYFSQTKITNTKMKTASGNIVKVNNSNTTTQHGKLDPEMSTGTTTTVINANYDKRILVGVMEGDYVADVATATLNKNVYPVSNIV